MPGPDHPCIAVLGIKGDHAQMEDGDEVVLVEPAVLPGVPAFEVRGEDISVLNIKFHILPLRALLPSLDEVSSAASRFFSGVMASDVLPKGTDPSRFHP